MSNSYNNKKQEKTTYIQRISLHNKTPEEADRINKLYEENLNLAYNLAKKYYKTGYWEFDDSVQIALMGLWKACLIWDPGKFKLSTLATNVITRDFIDYDVRQKKQPSILFNLEEYCVTDDLTLGDVIEDTGATIDLEIENKEVIDEINMDILYILEDIADELHITPSLVKIVYLVYIESTQGSAITTRNIRFVSKSLYNDIIDKLKIKLTNLS